MAEIETIRSFVGQKYQVSCEEEEVEILEKSAKYLNKKMERFETQAESWAWTE